MGVCCYQPPSTADLCRRRVRRLRDRHGWHDHDRHAGRLRTTRTPPPELGARHRSGSRRVWATIDAFAVSVVALAPLTGITSRSAPRPSPSTITPTSSSPGRPPPRPAPRWPSSWSRCPAATALPYIFLPRRRRVRIDHGVQGAPSMFATTPQPRRDCAIVPCRAKRRHRGERERLAGGGGRAHHQRELRVRGGAQLCLDDTSTEHLSRRGRGHWRRWERPCNPAERRSQDHHPRRRNGHASWARIPSGTASLTPNTAGCSPTGR